MTAKTLAEAALDILNASRASAPREPMHRLQDVRGAQPAGDVHDLGGATWENPGGNAIGGETSDEMGVATPPGVLPNPQTKEPMHKLHVDRAEEIGDTDELGHPTVKPDGGIIDNAPATGGAFTDAEYAHPTVSAPGEVDETTELTGEEIAEAHKAKVEAVKAKMKAKSCVEDVNAIFNGETLSEEFRNKVTTIFEAAVVSRAVEVVEELEQEIFEAAEETVADIKKELEEQIDSYLGVMVEEWKQENALAIENGLRTEIAEGFMDGLKKLLQDHYIEVPDDKVDLVESLAAQVEELTQRLNESMNKNIDLQGTISEATQEKIINDVCAGLTTTQSSKVRTLAEGVEFSTAAEYVKKLTLIRENYVGRSMVKDGKPGSVSRHVALIESGSPAVVEEAPAKAVSDDPLIAAAVSAISRTHV